MPKNDAKPIQDALAILRSDLADLDAMLSDWNFDNTAAGRKQTALGERIVLSARRLDNCITELSYRP